jgi:hypothetical protein
VVPVTLVVQFASSPTSDCVERSAGAAAFTVDTWDPSASRSSCVRVGCDPKPPRCPPAVDDPGRTISRFVPIAANACSTCDFAPAPMAIIAMTAPTPMMIPRVVKNERSLLRKTARSATRRVCQRFMPAP